MGVPGSYAHSSAALLGVSGSYAHSSAALLGVSGSYANSSAALWECRAHMHIQHPLQCGEFLTFPSICFLPVVYVFSHAQGAGQEGAAARKLVRRFARSVRMPARLPKLCPLYRSTHQTHQATTVLH